MRFFGGQRGFGKKKTVKKIKKGGSVLSWLIDLQKKKKKKQSGEGSRSQKKQIGGIINFISAAMRDANSDYKEAHYAKKKKQKGGMFGLGGPSTPEGFAKMQNRAKTMANWTDKQFS